MAFGLSSLELTDKCFHLAQAVGSLETKLLREASMSPGSLPKNKKQ